MPKGVKHKLHTTRSPSATSVQSAVMPKGVEHSEVGAMAATSKATVQSAVMPKGVEHTRLRPQLAIMVCVECSQP